MEPHNPMPPSLLQLAFNAYNSPNRAQYPLNGGVVTNLEAVEHYLRTARTQLPCHLGVPITLANIQTFRGKISQALRGYQQCLSATGSDAEKCLALSYLAVWHHYAGELQKSDNVLKQLQQISAEHAFGIKALLNTITNVLSQPSTQFDHAPLATHRRLSVEQAIITLGYVLNDDGSMAPALIQRLQLTLELARRQPDSLLLVTGGLARQGKTEAQQMKRWLVEHGIAPGRIIAEDQATNTIDNARLSLELLELHRVTKATLVSASIHVHRSQLLFETVMMKMQQPPITFDHFAVDDGLATEPVPTGQIRRNCYIDALRAYGFPAFNCEPFVQI